MKIVAKSQIKGLISIFCPESGKIYYFTIVVFNMLKVVVIRSDNQEQCQYIFLGSCDVLRSNNYNKVLLHAEKLS